MATFRYHLGEEKTPLVELDWNPGWKDMAVRAHGIPVGVIASREGLLAGSRFDLPGGEELLIRLPRGTFVVPEVTLGGRRLYPPQQSPRSRLQRASTVALILGGAQIIWGLRPLFGGAAPGELPPESWAAVVLGSVLLALGGLARLGSLAALIAAFTLLVVSWGFGVYAVTARAREQGVPVPFVVALVVQFFLLLVVYQGVNAIREMKRG
jgi:hypothetical protein